MNSSTQRCSGRDSRSVGGSRSALARKGRYSAKWQPIRNFLRVGYEVRRVQGSSIILYPMALASLSKLYLLPLYTVQSPIFMPSNASTSLERMTFVLLPMNSLPNLRERCSCRTVIFGSSEGLSSQKNFSCDAQANSSALWMLLFIK